MIDEVQVGATPQELATLPPTGAPQATSVSFDIKPEDPENRVNAGAKGVLPAAILSTEPFDARTVDVSSLRFGPGRVPEAHGKGHWEDVNGDGLVDLVLHFSISRSGLTQASTFATVEGQTTDGQRIFGRDLISVVK